MGAVIFAIIIIYGYAKINDLLARQQEVCILQMGSDMKAKVEEVGQSLDVVSYSLHTCGEYNQVCFWGPDLTRGTEPCPQSSFTWSGNNFDYLFTQAAYAKDRVDSAVKPPYDIYAQVRLCRSDVNMGVYKKDKGDVQYFPVGTIAVGERRNQNTNALIASGTFTPPPFNCFRAKRGIVYLQIQGTGNTAVITADPVHYEQPT
jgi:hypothetical protein